MPHKLNTKDNDFLLCFNEVLHAKREDDVDVSNIVLDIINEIRQKGDAALLDYTRRFDERDVKDMSELFVSTKQLTEAYKRISVEEKKSLVVAIERIKDFHEGQLPEDVIYNDSIGMTLGWRYQPLESVGLYVPGGIASYPSSVLMNTLPATVAGVERQTMVVPAPKGEISDMVLAAAYLAGISEIWTIGGAQAIAALAYGTESIDAVDKIIGPGNAYVATAKRQVFGKVGIDSIAGPSEILILADKHNNPDCVAMDLLAQAEHDEAAQSILITDDTSFAEIVADAVENTLPKLPRQKIATASWLNHGAIIVVKDWQEAIHLTNVIAPEHLQIAVENPEEIAESIRHAGAIFLGSITPEAIGDYVAGPNHVLPTARTARFSSGLGVLDFLKRSTIMKCTEHVLETIGPAAMSLAEAEGLQAHKFSVAMRLEQNENMKND